MINGWKMNDLYKAYAEVDENLSFMEDVYIDKNS